MIVSCGIAVFKKEIIILSMKKRAKLELGEYYHIYNRGNNKERIFKNDENYHFFFRRFVKHLCPILKLYAYCLIPNHFHLLIKIKDFSEIPELTDNTHKYQEEEAIEKFLSQKFSNFFNAYSKSFNSYYNRTGRLFQERFGRIKVETEEYLHQLVFYIHTNPKKHGIKDDFMNYPYSSFQPIISNTPTIIEREEILEWFGRKDEFVKFHLSDNELDHIDGLILE
jgi:putative transposase